MPGVINIVPMYSDTLVCCYWFVNQKYGGKYVVFTLHLEFFEMIVDSNCEYFMIMTVRRILLLLVVYVGVFL